MPKLIPNAEFNRKFSDVDRNSDCLEHFLAKGVTAYNVDGLDIPEGYQLVSGRPEAVTSDGAELVRIRLIYTAPNGDKEIAYAVNLAKYTNTLFNGRHCTQVMVWRSPYERHEDVLFKFAKKMFRHFISEYVVIATDTEQTNAGRTFWQRRILESLDRGDYVYFIDCNDLDDDMSVITNRIDSEQEFTDKWFEHGWGEHDDYKDRLFLISTQKIK